MRRPTSNNADLRDLVDQFRAVVDRLIPEFGEAAVAIALTAIVESIGLELSGTDREAVCGSLLLAFISMRRRADVTGTA